MSKLEVYVVAGPATIGNAFGRYGYDVPAGKFAVVSDGEYSNGGHGPIQHGARRLYDSEAEAQAAAQAAAQRASA